MARRHLLMSIGFLALISPALAQNQGNGVQQSGPVTPGHASAWRANGVIGDAGASSAPTQANQGAIFGGLNVLGGVCTEDGYNSLTLSPSGYHQLCLFPNSLGGGLISYNAYNGATPLGLSLDINGSIFNLPGSGGGNMVGPTSPVPTANDIVLWNGGLTTKDSGVNIASNAITGLTAASIIGANSSPYNAPGFQNVIQNSSLTASQLVVHTTGVTPYDVLQIATDVPTGSSATSVNGIGSYMRCGSVGGFSGNCVNYYSQNIGFHSNAIMWGANLSQIDDFLQAGTYTGVTLIGTEYDQTATNAATIVEGVNLSGSSTVQPTLALGFSCNRLSEQSHGTAKWTYCFRAFDGQMLSNGGALYAGALAESGTNVGSSAIQYAYFNGSGAEHNYFTEVDTSQNFFIGNGVGSGQATLLVDGQVSVPSAGFFNVGANRVAASSGNQLILANGGSTTSIAVGNSTATLQLSIGNGGTASKYVCVDSSNVVVIQSGAC